MPMCLSEIIDFSARLHVHVVLESIECDPAYHMSDLVEYIRTTRLFKTLQTTHPVASTICILTSASNLSLVQIGSDILWVVGAIRPILERQHLSICITGAFRGWWYAEAWPCSTYVCGVPCKAVPFVRRHWEVLRKRRTSCIYK